MDEDLRERCLAEGLSIGLRDGTFESLPHRNRGWTATGERTEEHRRNLALYEHRKSVARTERLHRTDGLDTIDYKLIERSGIAGPDGKAYPHVERVLVEF